MPSLSTCGRDSIRKCHDHKSTILCSAAITHDFFVSFKTASAIAKLLKPLSIKFTWQKTKWDTNTTAISIITNTKSTWKRCWTTQDNQGTQLMLTNPRDAIRGQSRSPNTVSLYMLRMVSCYCSIVALSLRRTRFWDSTSNYSVTSKPGLRLLMDIGTNTYRSDTYDFLLMFHWDYYLHTVSEINAWVTFDPDLKVTTFFDIEYLRNDTR